MKRNFLSIAMLLLVMAAVTAAANTTLTEDPLTGLPVVPSPDRLHLGNQPVVLPETQVCKSKALMNFYRPNGIQVNSTVAWYASRLLGFKKTHAWANARTQDTFYKSDGTAIVSITGDPGPDGQDAEVYGIVYGKFTPGISEIFREDRPEHNDVALQETSIVCDLRLGNSHLKLVVMTVLSSRTTVRTEK
jgi:hypothetical protein